MVEPGEVHAIIGRHLILDGYDFVLDTDASRGSWIVDALDGTRYLDLFSMYASAPLGLNHPALTSDEMRARLGRVAANKPANGDVYTTELAAFVATFERVMGDPALPRLFLISGGTLAVENALKVAFDWKSRRNEAAGRPRTLGTKVLHLTRAFHGRSGYTLSLTNTDPNKTQYFPKFDWPRIDNPKLSFPLTEENLADAERREQAALAQAKQFLHERKDDIAAFIMEPIQGEGGDNHFRPEFIRAMRQLCDENDMLLIFDEVQAGVGITGSMWSFQHFGVEPDMFCFGKKTQVAGFASNDRIFELAENVFTVSSRINSTWGGNLTDMVRAQRYFEIIDEENLVENTARVGEYFLGELRRFQEEFPQLVSNVRGRGLMAAFDLPSGEIRDKALEAFMAFDVMVLSSGHRSARFRPPLNLSMDEAGEGIRRMEKALRDLA